ncbi:hypothetical protein Tco_1036691, partial [Tanacetum coccineum]
NTMAKTKCSAQPPTRTDEQIVLALNVTPSGDTVLDFVNELGYPEPVELVSSIRTNYVYQPWRGNSFLLTCAWSEDFWQWDKPEPSSANAVEGFDHQIMLSMQRGGENLSLSKVRQLKFWNGIPDPLITEAIQHPVLSKYLKMVAELSLETPQEKGEGEGDNADLEWAIKLSLDPAFLQQGRGTCWRVTIREIQCLGSNYKCYDVVGKGKAVVTEEQVAHSLVDLSKKKRTTDQRTESDTESGAPKGDKFKMDRTHWKINVSLAGPNPEPWRGIPSTAYPKEKSKVERSLIPLLPDPSHQTVNVQLSSDGSLHRCLICRAIITVRVAKNEQEMLNVKKTDVVASIRSHNHMNNKKSANKTDNYRYTIALMEALIADGTAMGKFNQEERYDSALLGLLNPPPEADDQQLKEIKGSLRHSVPNNSNSLLTDGISLEQERLDEGNVDESEKFALSYPSQKPLVRVYCITHGGLGGKDSTSTTQWPSDREAVRIADANSQGGVLEYLFLLNIQEKLNHLPKTDKTSLHTAVNMWIRNLVIRNRVGDLQLGIESYQTKINLERPNWDAANYYFKEDYTIVPKPRAVVYRDINDQRKLMRLNELHKFSDGTLTRVMEKLDQMVKVVRG